MPSLKARFPLLQMPVNLSGLFAPRRAQILTPFTQAIEELERRKKDTGLRKKIEEYLKEDIPQHFQDGPILYLARHVATPNFETLRFLHLVEPLNIPTVIGQDVKDKFVPHNQLKKALGRMSISTGMSKKGDAYHEQFSNVCVIDFNTSNGKQFKDIRTTWGEGLVDFHQRLFAETCNGPVRIVDDSEWIDRQSRGDLLEHYKRFLALFLVHGVLFEDFETEDEEEKEFVQKVLIPAFRFVERKFGYAPLITQLTPTSVESPGFWLRYPKNIGEVIAKSAKNDGV